MRIYFKNKEFRIFFLCIISIFRIGTSYSQTPWNNIIPNYSFESTDVEAWLTSELGSTEEGLGDMRYSGCADCFEGLNKYEKIVQYWSYCDNWTVPNRRYVTCGAPLNDPICTPDITYQPLTIDDGSNSEFQRFFSGEFCAYTGTGEGEFVIIEPEFTIVKNNFYYIEAFVGTDDSYSGQTGTIDLFTKKPHVCGYNQYITEYGGNGPSQTVLLCEYPFLGEDSLGWTRYRGYFQATEDFEWLSIGSADQFYWDDLKIIEVSSNLCRDQWYFDNTVFNYPVEVFQASDFIIAGTGVDPEAGHQDGPVTVLATSHTVFRAGNEIILEDGFEVDSINGAVFEAIIEPCQDICPPTSIANKRFYCISDSTAIGLEDFDGTFASFTWYPSTHLDNPNVANPTFIPPGSNGTITYTVHYEKDCYVDEYHSAGFFLVTVNYSDGLDTPPTVTYADLTYENDQLSTTILVNSSVDVVDICFTTTALGERCYTYYRGIDFDGLSIDFSINHLEVSCCEDVEFIVSAESYCGGLASTTFNWIKSGDFGIIGTLPNVISPLTLDGMNDFYCFSVNMACTYTFEVFHPWGPTVFYGSGFIPEDGEICPWDGKKTNGHDLIAGNYWVDVRLYNDCGEEEFRHSLCVIAGEGLAPIDSPEFDDANFQNFQESDELQINFINNQLYIFGNDEENKEIIIVDNLGRIVLLDNFVDYFSVNLATGIYYITTISENGLIIKKKIIVL